MQAIIKESIRKSYSYQDYRNKISELLLEGKSSGNEQSEALTKYSELNKTRMNRLDKTIEITAEYTEQLSQLKGNYIWLVVAEGWCGDAAQIVPVIHKMAMQTPAIELKMVFRDENEDLMNQFLTNGAKGIPKLIIVDKNSLEVLGDFGPRPTGAQQFILDYKAAHGKIDETAKADLQLWYFKDKGLSIQKEIMDVMSGLIN